MASSSSPGMADDPAPCMDRKKARRVATCGGGEWHGSSGARLKRSAAPHARQGLGTSRAGSAVPQAERAPLACSAAASSAGSGDGPPPRPAAASRRSCGGSRRSARATSSSDSPSISMSGECCSGGRDASALRSFAPMSMVGAAPAAGGGGEGCGVGGGGGGAAQAGTRGSSYASHPHAPKLLGLSQASKRPRQRSATCGAHLAGLSRCLEPES